MHDGYFGIGTHRVVVEFQRKFDPSHLNGEVGVVDNLTAELITEQVNRLPDVEQSKQFMVLGIVRNEGGEPATDLVVKAFDKDLRPKELKELKELGLTRTDKQGRYEISYGQSQFIEPINQAWINELDSETLPTELIDSSLNWDSQCQIIRRSLGLQQEKNGVLLA